MFTGKISRHEMEEEHPLELEEIEQGRAARKMDPASVRRRKIIFAPVAVVISVVLLTGLYFFVTFEQTAITTVPRQNPEIFVPAPEGP
jgi:hypothetical protein